MAEIDRSPQTPDRREQSDDLPIPQPSQADSPPSEITLRWQQAEFAGPLPHPDILLGYEHVLPGAAERILGMVEKQGEHRRELEKTVVVGGNRRANIGLWLGFIIAILFLVASVLLIWNGYEVAGTIIGSVDLVALVAVFVVGRTEQRQEREEKAKLAE